MDLVPKEVTTAGKVATLHSVGLGDMRSEPDQLGRNATSEVKEKIWKGAYVDMFDLLIDTPEGDERKGGKDCAHARDCGHWSYKYGMRFW